MDPSSLFPWFGNTLLTVAAFIVALSIIVAIHEYGHYIVGRWSGIQAEVFSIGFGPAVWSRIDRRGTRWQIAALPFGGYVKFLGDANAASAGADEATMARLSDAERRHTMHGAPLWARAATVAAGPVFNFILSIVVFAGLYLAQGIAVKEPTVAEVYPLPGATQEFRTGDRILSVGGIMTPDYEALAAAGDTLAAAAAYDYRILRDGQEVAITGPVPFPARVASVGPGSAAYDAGLKEGDVLLTADGAPLYRFKDIQDKVKATGDKPIALTVWRDGKELSFTLTPRRMDVPNRDGSFETRNLIGINGDFFFYPVTEAVGPVKAVTAAAGQTWFVIKSSLSGLWHMLTGAISSCNLRGPLGIAETSGAAASQGIADFIGFIALLSAAVGFMNLFPIPMLDGGHLVFHAWEWATGRPPPERVTSVALTVGLVVVLGLMAFGLTNDLFCP